MKIPLTRREAEVVGILAGEGASTYRDVGRVLGISPNTVRVHVCRIAARLPYHHLAAKAAVTHYAQTVVLKRCDDLG